MKEITNNLNLESESCSPDGFIYSIFVENDIDFTHPKIGSYAMDDLSTLLYAYSVGYILQYEPYLERIEEWLNVSVDQQEDNYVLIDPVEYQSLAIVDWLLEGDDPKMWEDVVNAYHLKYLGSDLSDNFMGIEKLNPNLFCQYLQCCFFAGLYEHALYAYSHYSTYHSFKNSNELDCVILACAIINYVYHNEHDPSDILETSHLLLTERLIDCYNKGWEHEWVLWLKMIDALQNDLVTTPVSTFKLLYAFIPKEDWPPFGDALTRLYDEYNTIGTVNTYLKIGQDLRALGDMEGAFWIYNAGIYNVDRDVENDIYKIYCLRAYMHLLKNNYQEVVDDCTIGINMCDTDGYLYMYRSSAYFNLGNNEKCIEDADKALLYLPNNKDIHNVKGIALLNIGRYEEALQVMNQALAIDPDFAFGYNNRGNAKDSLGRHHEAIADYDKAISINSNYWVAYLNRARTKTKIKDYESALEDFNIVISKEPNNYDAYRYLADMKYANDENIEAIEAYSKSIELHPTEGALNNRGNAREQMGDYQGAIDDYTDALKLVGDLAYIYCNRGFAKTNMLDYDGALLDFEKSIDLDPNHYKAYNNRAELEMARYNNENALLDLLKCIDINPDFVKAYNNLGLVHEQLFNYNDAISAFDKAIELDPENADSYQNRMNVKKVIGDYNGAKEDEDMYNKLKG